MKDLMEKYYNVIYYCAYKILFYFLYSDAITLSVQINYNISYI